MIKTTASQQAGARSSWTKVYSLIFAMLLLPACRACVPSVYAHDPGLSVAELRIDSQHLALHLAFARADIETLLVLDANKDDEVSPPEFATSRSQLESLGSGILEVSIDGQRCPAETVAVQLDTSNAVHFRLEFSSPAGSKLSLKPALLPRLPQGHRQFLSIRNEQNRLIAERMLDATAGAFEISLAELAPTSGMTSFQQFLILGIEHILAGYDHLAFLFGLLIVGASLSTSVKIITSFTVAHSVTLALATLNVVQIPSSVVEPLIAASIVYVGIENIFSRNLDRRWLLTFGFGLVHGFGFASVLRELGIGSGAGGTAIPLVSFNLGVEIGQIAIALIILPAVWKLRAQPTFITKYVPACSVLITLIGAFWLVERILP